ncbi:AI-2E family transporter [Candidatus Peribacteria bacterium]|jgi:predicted PurR-regulated permease PerM|nr:AI-2E family transporter [Candidatus Peribacteria bacterium]MBT4020802.1 AI-2E family transporter [Candidatus Peribacteria bacterium]MBT4241012.1 AI-2E family transporter [Candidatus Peribacteria bacterium]MBT4474490.1 AI-2E family transporter [Candidatus Peribacteria bacterium]
MPKKKNDQPAFKTIKIFGKKAHELIDSAKTHFKTPKKAKEANDDLPIKKQKEKDEIVMHVSISSIVKATFAIVAVALLFYFFYEVRDKILILLLAMFIAVIIDPGVNFFERRKIPRGLAIVFVYVIVLAVVLFLIISLIPIIAEQIQQMSIKAAITINKFLENPTFYIPFLSAEINKFLNNLVEQVLSDVYQGGFLQHIQQFGQRLTNAAQGSFIFVFGVGKSVVGFVVQLIFVLVLAFFFQLEREKVVKWARVFFPYRYRRYAEGKAEAIHQKLAQWIRGQLMLSLAIGILVFIALTVLRMPYALTLAVLAAFTEFVPVVGPIIAAIPSIFIALAQFGFFPAMIVAIVYYGIQWCENNLLVPLIMQRAVGLSPIAIMFAMLVGISFPDTIHPVLGILLAVPMATIISIFLKDYRSSKGAREHE